MKVNYPVIFTQSGSDYIAYIPDFDMYTQGSTLDEAVKMARDELGILGIDYLDDNIEIPNPSNINNVKASHPDDIVKLVDVDFEEHRRNMAI